MIETALSLTISGKTSFPDAVIEGGRFDLELEKTKKATVGEVTRKALAGTGVNLACEWDEPITAPVLRWRPDFFYAPDSGADIVRTREEVITVHCAWLGDYQDVGLSFGDFPAKVTVNGLSPAGPETFGTARLSSATTRADLGHREVSAMGMISTATHAKEAADTLLGRTCNPDYLRMLKVEWWPDLVYRTMQTNWGGAFVSGISDSGFDLAAIRVGDQLQANDPFSDSILDGGSGKDTWPASFRTGTTQSYDDVEDLWYVTKSDSGDTADTHTHIVRYVEHTWDGTELFVTTGLTPKGNPIYSDAGDLDSGTY
jgi:hypothetical protein